MLTSAVVIAVLVAQSVLWAPVLRAATAYTWVAAGAGFWSTAANWSPNTNFPGAAAGDSATFNTINPTVNFG